MRNNALFIFEKQLIEIDLGQRQELITLSFHFGTTEMLQQDYTLLILESLES